MSSSTVLGDEVCELAGWASELVVEGDGGGEGEQPAGDSGAEAVECSSAVTLEGEDVFEGLEDALDALPEWSEVRALPAFVFADGTQDRDLEGGGPRFELGAVVALVADYGEGPVPRVCNLSP